MPTAQTAFDRAENACALFLAGVLGLKYDPSGNTGDLVRDDYLDADIVGKAAFYISGGPLQEQNLGRPAHNQAWNSFGSFLMQFDRRADAVLALGKLQNNPAQKKASGFIFAPNVRNFEMLEHPELTSTLLIDEKNEILGRVWTLRARFRVVYDTTGN
jgi:hypothetical protein